MAGKTRRGFGAIRQLPSGRFQASYVDSDGRRRPAPMTFDTQAEAQAWLAGRRRAGDELVLIAETLSEMSSRLRALAAS